MKNLQNLIITNTESYLKSKDVIEVGYLLKNHYNIPTTIKVTGKEKCCLKIGNFQMENSKYEALKEDLKVIDVKISKTSKKHNSRISRCANNENRIKEESSYNLQLIGRIKDYPKQLC